jgi:hypothetical protein
MPRKKKIYVPENQQKITFFTGTQGKSVNLMNLATLIQTMTSYQSNKIFKIGGNRCTVGYHMPVIKIKCTVHCVKI